MNAKLIIAIALIAVLLGTGCVVAQTNDASHHVNIVWTEQHGVQQFQKIVIPEDHVTCYTNWQGNSGGISCLQDNR